MTALRAAMQKAGLSTEAQRLEEAAAAAIKFAHAEQVPSCIEFKRLILNKPDLIWELFKAQSDRVIADYIAKRIAQQSAARPRADGAMLMSQTAAVAPRQPERNPGGGGQGIRADHNARAAVDRDTHAAQAAAGEGGHSPRGDHSSAASPPAPRDLTEARLRIATKSIRDTLTFDGKPARSMTRSAYQDYARRKGAKAWAADAFSRIMPPAGTMDDANISDDDIAAIWNRARQLNGVEIRP